MSQSAVRISDKSRKILRGIAADEGASMQAIIEKAIELYRRQRLLADVNNAYAALRQDGETWSEVEKERSEWEGTLGDGLQPGEKWAGDGTVIREDGKKK
ncbi:MAG: toxin-antitoxin system protein [bacterium]